MCPLSYYIRYWIKIKITLTLFNYNYNMTAPLEWLILIVSKTVWLLDPCMHVHRDVKQVDASFFQTPCVYLCIYVNEWMHSTICILLNSSNSVVLKKIKNIGGCYRPNVIDINTISLTAVENVPTKFMSNIYLTYTI